MRRSNAPTVSPNSEDQKGMDHVKLPLRPNRAPIRSSSNRNSNPRLRFYLYASISIAFVLFCYILLFGNRHNENYRYRIVIDGGSTGTRIHVFKYGIRDGNFVPDFSERGLVSMKVNPGLSAYADNPDLAGGAVAELVEFGKKNVPSDQWGETEVRLMATAGMRLLKGEDQERVLNACRTVLNASVFRFRDEWATVISGSDEGLYAWIVANYALGTLGAEPSETTGIIELGGASAQVTFVSNEPMPPEFSRQVKFGNFTYNLYSHSLLQFGQDVAFDLLKKSLVSEQEELDSESLHIQKTMDPCTPRGYSPRNEAWKLSRISLNEKSTYPSALLPSGNFSECRRASVKLLQKDQDKCSYKMCSIGSTFMPKLHGKFLATENFFHTSKFFGLRQRAFLSHMMVAGQKFCGEDWSRLKHKFNFLGDEDLLRYCFSSAYIVALLHDSLGIDLDNRRIQYANQVRNIPLDWALGAFVLQSAADMDEHTNQSTTLTGGKYRPWVLLVFGIFVVLIFASCFVSKSRKPPSKTIYDLQKGKYIVTRISKYSSTRL